MANENRHHPSVWYEDLSQRGVPYPGKSVKVHYTGWLTNGTVRQFEGPGRAVHLQIGLGRVIKGWDEGVA